MALRKNKIELLDKSYSLRISLDQWCDDEYFSYYEDYDDCYYWTCNSWNQRCDCEYCYPDISYGYIPQPEDNRMSLSRRGIIRSMSRPVIMGREIDMNTIYSKEIMRERKIDEILGLSLRYPTIGDIWSPIKK